MQVNDWGLAIDVVPEPVTAAMIFFAMALTVIGLFRRLGISKGGMGTINIE
jgi:hypothetical protein